MSEHRSDIIRNLLTDLKMDAWLMWRTASLTMSLGYFPCWGLSFCLFPKAGQPVLYLPALEPKDRLPEAGTLIKEYPWGLLDASDPWEVLFEEVFRDIKAMGMAPENVLCLKDSSQNAPNSYSGESPALNDKFLDRIYNTFKVAEGEEEDALKGLFTIKLPNEIENIRLANKVAGKALKTFYEHAVPGMTEARLAALIEMSIQETMGTSDIIYSRGWAMVQAGKNSIDGGRYSRTTGKSLEEGEPVMLELATCVNGHWSDLTRTTAATDLKAEQKKIFEIVAKAQLLALEQVAPGAIAEDIDRTAREHIEANGLGEYFTHATGHHTGFRYHDYGPVLAPGVMDALQPGMVITVEPGIYSAEHQIGCRIEDNVLVTETGYELLSPFPKGLFWDQTD